MLRSLTCHGRDWLSGGGYLMLLLAGLHWQTASVWSMLLTVLFVLALLAWRANLARLRAVADTPTSRIASATQGYVELIGQALADPHHTVYSPGHHLPCLWYRYRHYTREDNRWRQTESGESDAPFQLDDGSGRCVIEPAGAEIQVQRKETLTQGDSRLEEELLLAGERLYVLGDFATLSAHASHDERRAVGELLADWKDDPASLHDRFDLDRNGQIDDQEWQLARQAAHRQIAQERQAALSAPPTHVVTRPRHGRPFLISTHPPETLAGRYRLVTWLHGLAACGSLAGLAVAVSLL